MIHVYSAIKGVILTVDPRPLAPHCADCLTWKACWVGS